MWFVLVVIIIFAFLVPVFFIAEDFSKSAEDKRSTNKQKIDQLIGRDRVKDEQPTATFVSHDYDSALSLDEKKKQICIIHTVSNTNGLKSYASNTFNFSDIISSEVIVDNETVTSTSRGSQIGGAVVGGALLGGVGAIIGGLSGKTKSTEEVHKIDIKLTIDDLSNPVCRINFLRPVESVGRGKWNGHKKDSEEYKKAISEVERWQGMFDIILRKQNV